MKQSGHEMNRLVRRVSKYESMTFINPTLPNVGAPDPGVLRWGIENPVFLVVTTGGDSGGSFPIRMSETLSRWTQEPINYIFRGSRGPAWSIPGNDWAPELHTAGFKDDRVVAYFVRRHAKTGIPAIGAAVADTGHGRLDPSTWVFEDSGAPLVHDETGYMGYIDPTHFYDSSTDEHWLLYKNEGNVHHEPVYIWAAKLASDGLSLVPEEPKRLIQNDPALRHESRNIEAPWVIKHEPTSALYLFYSGPGYCISCGYTVDVARSENGMLGPWKKYARNPILAEGDGNFRSPGHCSVVQGINGGLAIVYHAFQHSAHRFLMLDELEFRQDPGDDHPWPKLKYTGTKASDLPVPLP